MCFPKMLISQTIKIQELFQTKGAKETWQLNARCGLGFPFTVKDMAGMDGEMRMRSAD